MANGQELALEDINSSKFLGNTQLKLDHFDDQTSPSVGAQLAGQHVGKYPIILGSITTGQAAAEAPILSNAGQPAVFAEAGGDGVLVGPSLFRLTPLQSDLFPKSLKYLQDHKAKTVAILYTTDVGTMVNINQVLASQAAKYGIAVVGGVTTQSSTTDISGSISKLLDYHSDAVIVLVTGAQNTNAASLISQKKYEGIVIAQAGASSVLEKTGATANGWTWAVSWSPPGTNAASQAFTEKYTAKFGSPPPPVAAEAYDEVYYAARAIKAANSTSKTALTAALKSVGEAGFPGLLGDVKVVNNQEEPVGLLVQVQNGKIVPVTG
jgi:branched-chain amino acid transport system substrate-binding protein